MQHAAIQSGGGRYSRDARRFILHHREDDTFVELQRDLADGPIRSGSQRALRHVGEDARELVRILCSVAAATTSSLLPPIGLRDPGSANRMSIFIIQFSGLREVARSKIETRWPGVAITRQ